MEDWAGYSNKGLSGNDFCPKVFTFLHIHKVKRQKREGRRRKYWKSTPKFSRDCNTSH